MSLSRGRDCVAMLPDRIMALQRRACIAVSQPRSTQRRELMKSDADRPHIERLHELGEVPALAGCDSSRFLLRTCKCFCAGNHSGWPVVSDTQRRRNVYEVTAYNQDGTMRWESGNGHNIAGYRTFATWLKQINTAEASEFVIHLDTSLGRKAVYYRPHETTSYNSGTQIRVVSVKDKTGDFNDGPWVRLERDFIADAQAA